MKRPLFILATLALLVSAYLVFNHYSGQIPVCSNSGCETVLTSKYSELFGIPTALFGLIYDLGLVVLLASLVLGFKIKIILAKFYIFIGLVVTLGLIYLQSAVIGAFCAWCTTHALLIIALSLISVYGLSKEK
ncbi:hypothetical protein KC644_02965 [Candidatus Berkelbacteria bacterium]|nr:hypothetical protein [Candidatus Berkelbacteria bacterium]